MDMFAVAKQGLLGLQLLDSCFCGILKKIILPLFGSVIDLVSIYVGSRVMKLEGKLLEEWIISKYSGCVMRREREEILR